MPVYKVIATNDRGQFVRDRVLAESSDKAIDQFGQRNPGYTRKVRVYKLPVLSLDKVETK